MSKKMLLLSVSLVVVLMLGVAGVAQALSQWVNANGGSCDAVCARQSLRPVVSGTHGNGQPYYVCSGNANGEGFRPGYNLRPNWASACYVAVGGREVAVRSYRCLCE